MIKRKLSKPTIIAIAVFLALAIAFAIFLPLYIKNNQENRQLYKEQKIRITAYGNDLGSYTIDQLLALDGVSQQDFTSVYDTSASDPVQKTYTGIELKKVFAALDIRIAEARSITFKASDGAVKLYTPQDITKANNVFIAYKVNGKPFTNGIDGLGHTRDTEDGGPFVVIRVSDTYSTNRCKLLTEVIIS